jgi:hypothetical protein
MPNSKEMVSAYRDVGSRAQELGGDTLALDAVLEAEGYGPKGVHGWDGALDIARQSKVTLTENELRVLAAGIVLGVLVAEQLHHEEAPND